MKPPFYSFLSPVTTTCLGININVKNIVMSLCGDITLDIKLSGEASQLFQAYSKAGSMHARTIQHDYA